MCENSDHHYLPWLWVGRVDQYVVEWTFPELLSANDYDKIDANKVPFRQRDWC